MLIKFDNEIQTSKESGNRFLRGLFVTGPDAGQRLQVWEDDTKDIDSLENAIIEGDLDLVAHLQVIDEKTGTPRTFWRVSNVDVEKRLKGDEAKAVRTLVNEAVRKAAEATGPRTVGASRSVVTVVAEAGAQPAATEEPDLAKS